MSGARLIAALTGNRTTSSVARPTILRSSGQSCGCCPACADNDDMQVLREANGPGPAGMSLSQPGDHLEVEADRAADSVLRSPGPSPERSIAPSAHNASNASGARPLPNDVRAFFEPRFAQSFSSVRVFHDDSAAQAARHLDANAFTVGRNIVFGAGRWSPGSSEGRRLLAHELAHVVQQDNRPALHRTIQRDACKHDGFKPGGCAGLGYEDSAGDRVHLGVDSLIVELGLKRHFPGKWIGQVYSPPNLRKAGKKFGKIDALKVIVGSSLNLEILEIKSRNLTDGDGGCELAEDEALGYQEALNRINRNMHEVSLRLTKRGGYMIADKEGGQQCRSSAARRELDQAGINTKDESTMMAWCVYNSIQTRLNTAFKHEFRAINIKINSQGRAARNDSDAYPVFSWQSGKCGKKGTARKYMRFQVNTTGGLSYRCDKECVERDEDERQREDEVRVWRTLDKLRSASKGADKGAQDDKRPPADKRAPPPPQKDPGNQPFFEVSPDLDPFEQGAEIPAEGVDAAEVVALGIAGTAAVYTLHVAYQKAKTKAEKALIEKTAKLAIDRLAKKGAVDVAYKLNKPLQNLGKKAFEKAIDEADEVAKKLGKGIEKKVEKRLALRIGREAAKKGLLTGARAIAKAIPYVTAVIAIVKILGTAEALAAGADLTFGLDDPDVSVSGDTKVKAKPKSGKTADADVDLKDTHIELEVDGVPETSGSIDIKADNVKISGAPAKEGDPVTVDLKYNLKNTTITIRNDGIYKGGSIQLSGTVDIIDSDITIDLPPGTVLEPPKAGEKRVIKGVKVVIKKAGKSDGKGGGTGTGGGGGQGEGEGSGSQGSDKGIPGATSKDKPAANMPKMSDEARQLLTESFKDPNTKQVAEVMLSVKGTKPVDEAMVRRLNALKEKLKKHPKVLEEFLKRIRKQPGSDPLKDVIVPLEEALDDADKQKLPPAQTPAPGDDTSGKQQAGKPDDKQALPTNKPQPDKSKSTGIEFKKHKKWMTLSRTSDVDESQRETNISAPIKLTLTIGGEERVYLFSVRGTLAGKGDVPANAQGQIPPNRILLWEGLYDLTIPNGVYQDQDGKHPIHFTDAGEIYQDVFRVTRKKDDGGGKKPRKKGGK